VLDSLSIRLFEIMKKVRGWGSLTEKNIKDCLREIKLALLEADVHYTVVKEFIERTTTEAMGQKVIQSLTPAQQFTKIVYEHLVEMLGGKVLELTLHHGSFTVIMLVGLQGSGKTTTAVKLANFVKENYRSKPMLIAADIYRPAAVTQLELMAKKQGIDVFILDKEKPVKICTEGIRYARVNGFDSVIVDTAGRLELDENMMNELVELKKAMDPVEILLVADAATGQAAVSVARGFDEKLGITGIILSRMDSDARGGAALSMSYITGRKVKFIGTGEKIEDFEKFYPERIAGRILNMGDVLSLVEKVQRDFDEKRAKELEKKIKKDSFDLNDFLDQLRQLKRIGPLENLMEMIPGIPKKTNLKIDENQIKRSEAIINSMTSYERAHYKIINGSRRKRIALGSGTSVFEVNRLLNNFQQIKKIMKKIGRGGKIKESLISSIIGK